MPRTVKKKQRTPHSRVLASYRRRRAALIEFLGGKCVVSECGETDPNKLEFNHLKPRTWAASKLSRWARIARYCREALAGEIDLRCKRCNQKAGEPKADDRTDDSHECEIPD